MVNKSTKPIFSSKKKMANLEKAGWVLLAVVIIIVFGFVLHPSR